MKVAVLSGGRSSEHDVSRASGEGVAAGLTAAGHEVLAVTLERDGTWRLDGEELALSPGRGLLGADVAFPVLHGPFGEDGTVQGLLELLDVPYVGSGVLASAVCLDKVVAKELMARAGMAQVDYAGIRAARWADEPDAVLDELAALGLPVFVKPARLGSSVGIAKVTDGAALGDALDAAFVHDPCVIVEAMSTGTEVECSVLGSTRRAEASEPGEIVIASDWYDFAAKYEPGGMELRVPAQISDGGARAAAGDGRRGVLALRLLGPRARGLLRRGRACPAQRAQHDARLHADERLREALGGQRHAVRRLVERLCTLALERHAEERSYRF